MSETGFAASLRGVRSFDYRESAFAVDQEESDAGVTGTACAHIISQLSTIDIDDKDVKVRFVGLSLDLTCGY